VVATGVVRPPCQRSEQRRFSGTPCLGPPGTACLGGGHWHADAPDGALHNLMLRLLIANGTARADKQSDRDSAASGTCVAATPAVAIRQTGALGPGKLMPGVSPVLSHYANPNDYATMGLPSRTEEFPSFYRENNSLVAGSLDLL
jgi:hypothetical protein